MLHGYRGMEIERTFSHSPWDMAQMHEHQMHELYFLVSGKRRYFIEHSIYDMIPGNLILIPGGCLHRTVATGNDSHERYLIYFHDTTVSPLIKLLGKEHFSRFMGSHCLQLPSAITKQLLQNMEQLERECATPGVYADAITSHLLQDILLLALRYGTKKSPVSGESVDKIQEITRYITEHYTQELTLHDAAAMVCMEDTYFSKRFKTLTGVGFQEYLTQTRLHAAMQLLEHTNLSIGQIAESCGFSGGNYFGDVFRKWSGMSPTDHRRQYKEKHNSEIPPLFETTQT